MKIEGILNHAQFKATHHSIQDTIPGPGSDLLHSE